MSGCLLEGGQEGSSRPPLQPDLGQGPGLAWGLQWGLPVWVVGLCVLSGQGEEVLFGGAKPPVVLGAQYLVALQKKSRCPSGRK